MPADQPPHSGLVPEPTPGASPLTRRAFVATAAAGAAGIAAAALVGCAPKTEPTIAGGFVDDGGARGHRLRDAARFDAPRRTVRVPLVIVGGGIAGLSAAWRLLGRGFGDFVVLELEDQPGGNSRWGENEVSAYPWAAHYVPLPGRETVLVRELFEELGVYEGGAWAETSLAFAPTERLYRYGRWHEGLREGLADTKVDRDEFRRFDAAMAELRATGGFTLPLSAGARRDSPLDRTTMAAWLEAEGFRSPALRWYVDYACRDDYGALSADTSAWAGVHYFASRAPEDDERGPLTWPEGNGWIVRRLLARAGERVVTGAPVHRVARRGTGLRVLAGDAEYLCDGVIWAAPSFLASRLVEGGPPAEGFVYSPWITANLTLDRAPDEGSFPLAWDNVIHGSRSLGYVAATHQSLRAHEGGPTVWTWYHALAHGTASAGRELLLTRSWKEWTDEIVADLSRAHPDLRRHLRRVDVMRMGHAMVRPVPGFLSSPARERLAAEDGPVWYAHSDVSGLSLFEEAQARGVEAAEGALRRLAGTHSASRV